MEYSVPQARDLGGPSRGPGRGEGVARLGSVMSDLFFGLRTMDRTKQ